MKALKVVTFILAAVCASATVLAAVALYSKKYKKSYITVCE